MPPWYPLLCLCRGQGGGWAGLELSSSQMDLLYFLLPRAALGVVFPAGQLSTHKAQILEKMTLMSGGQQKGHWVLDTIYFLRFFFI